MKTLSSSGDRGSRKDGPYCPPWECWTERSDCLKESCLIAVRVEWTRTRDVITPLPVGAKQEHNLTKTFWRMISWHKLSSGSLQTLKLPHWWMWVELCIGSVPGHAKDLPPAEDQRCLWQGLMTCNVPDIHPMTDHSKGSGDQGTAWALYKPWTNFQCHEWSSET